MPESVEKAFLRIFQRMGKAMEVSTAFRNKGRRRYFSL